MITATQCRRRIDFSARDRHPQPLSRAGREASTKPPRGRPRRDSAPTVRKTPLQVASPAFLERLLGPGRRRPQLTSRSSAGNRLRTCHWPSYPPYGNRFGATDKLNTCRHGTRACVATLTRAVHDSSIFAASQHGSSPGRHATMRVKRIRSLLAATAIAADWQRDVLNAVPRPKEERFAAGSPGAPRTELPARDGIPHGGVRRSAQGPTAPLLQAGKRPTTRSPGRSPSLR